MIDPIIRVQHLTHTYVSGTVPKIVLRDISLEIPNGVFAAIIGFNGSGKSTLVQHFNGLLRPTSGKVFVDGIDMGAKRVDLRALRQRVGLLFQFPEAQVFERSVFADVAFGLRCMGLARSEMRKRVLEALDMVALPNSEYGYRSPFELSGGQRRRVALAGVLAMQPEILILDEPSVGLDAEGREEFYQCLRCIHHDRKVTILFVSHDMEEVVNLASYVYVLYQGMLVMQGTPQSVFVQEARLRQYNLTVPPLQELCSLLRQKGLDVPEAIFTLDEVASYLTQRRLTGVLL